MHIQDRHAGRVFRGTASFLIIAGVPVLVAGACSSTPSHPAELGGQEGGLLDHTTASDTGATADSKTASDVEADVGQDASAEAGDGGACDGGTTLCSGLCVDTQTDTDNCGQCGKTCGPSGSTVQCVGGTCQCSADAGQTLCNGTCVDILTDQNNCGQCGHICQVQGGAGVCSKGYCQPTVIAAPGQLIWDIAVNSTYVWWTQPMTPGQANTGALLRKAFAAGSSIESILSQQPDPRGIAIDLINVYWVDYVDTSVYQLKASGDVRVRDYPLETADGGVGPSLYSDPIAVAVDQNNVYWVSNSDGDVLSVPIGNPSQVEPTVIQAGEDHPYAIATDGVNVYWADTGHTTSPYDGAIRQKAVDGSGVAVTLASGEANPWAIAVDGKNVYWVDNVNPGFVKQVPIGGGNVVTLAQGEGAPYGIAIDAKNVYWTAFSDNTVNAVPIGGGTKIPYAVGQSSPSAIAVDQVNIYWVNSSAGQILEVTK